MTSGLTEKPSANLCSVHSSGDSCFKYLGKETYDCSVFGGAADNYNILGKTYKYIYIFIYYVITYRNVFDLKLLYDLKFLALLRNILKLHFYIYIYINTQKF